MANNQLAIVASPNKTTSYESLLQSQKELISKQINDLQNIVTVQCKLTGVNPLSQEMAAGALSIKIGKRPRDLLNPKAIKHMHSIFSVKDEISKKETRAISALFGLTATQVKDFFNSQRTKVRRFIRMSKEKAIQSAEGVQMQDRSLADVPNQPVPLNSTGPDPLNSMGPDPLNSTGPVPLNSTDPVPLNSTGPVPLNSTGPVPLNSTGPVPLNSTGPVPLNSTGPVPLNSTDPVPLNSTGPVPLNSTGPVPLNSTGPVPLNSTGPVPLNSTSPVPLNSIGPSSTEAPSSSKQDEVLPDTDDSEKYFIAHIFDLLRKEETFNGQVKLMEWILQMKNAAVLYWFLTNGGVMILASWLSQAAIEEQTTVLHVILRVLCHLPLHKALPAHMSAILQSVNKLRFYRGSDISKRAKTLLSRWSKMFARSQAMRKSNANISAVDAQNEMLLKQSIGEIMENESLERLDNPGAIYSLQENSENSSWSQSVKLLTGPSDDSNMKLLKGGTSAHRGRRKVQLVEQPGQKPASRGPQVARLVSTAQSRPLSADDIQKAKMRAQFMRSKYGESYVSPQAKTEALRASSTSQASKAHVQPKVEEHATSIPSMTPLAAKPLEQPKVEEHATSASSITHLAAEPLIQPNVEEHKTPVQPVSGDELQEVPVNGKQFMNSEEPVWKKCKRLHISWVTPPGASSHRRGGNLEPFTEININAEWSVCSGENSKEVDVQNNRIKREKEVFYNSILEIPPNPKEPWDREMDYDDSLTPEIPSVQLPDDEDNMVAEPTEVAPDSTSNYAAGTSTVAENSNKNMPEPDLELLAALLKNPEIVFALTAGQGGNLSSEQMVKLLDAVKANAASGGSVGSLVDGLVEKKQEQRVEVSLPSPTPSSNPVTSGWRQESATNPFSRQSVTVNGDPYAIPGVYYQETSTHQAVAPITHQRFSNMVPDQRNSPAAINSVAASSLTQQAFSPATYQTFSDMVPERGLSLQGVNAASNDYFSSGHSGSQLQPQWQVATEPRLSQVQSYTGRETLASSQYSYSEQNSSNYNPYGTREYAQPAASRTGASWAGNGRYSDQPGFESWSPENSPTRSHEYADYSDPNVRNYNYRPEMSRMQQDHSRYRVRDGRNDGSRWRDRRR